MTDSIETSEHDARPYHAPQPTSCSEEPHSPLPQQAPALVSPLKDWAFSVRHNGDILVHAPGAGVLVSAKATAARELPEEILHALASALIEQCRSTAKITDEQIVAAWQGMPGGPDAWLKQFGFIQFARRVLELRPAPRVMLALPVREMGAAHA